MDAKSTEELKFPFMPFILDLRDRSIKGIFN
jgi:hypothetical protein